MAVVREMKSKEKIYAWEPVQGCHHRVKVECWSHWTQRYNTVLPLTGISQLPERRLRGGPSPYLSLTPTKNGAGAVHPVASHKPPLLMAHDCRDVALVGPSWDRQATVATRTFIWGKDRRVRPQEGKETKRTGNSVFRRFVVRDLRYLYVHPLFFPFTTH
jgi:hypothetical protein